MAEPEDNILIEQTRNGQIAAFELLVRRYQELVAATAYGLFSWFRSMLI